MPTPLNAARPVSAIPIQARVEIARQRRAAPGQPAPLASLMAERLLEHEANHGAATADDLARDGFSPGEIIEHGPEASALAARRAAARANRGDLDRAA